MSRPEWLNQVQEVPAPTTANVEGKSETGVVLGAIAEAMQNEGHVRFAAGEVMGVVIKRAAGSQYSVSVSSGDDQVDIERLALQHGVSPAAVALVPAAEMLAQYYHGTAACLPVPAERSAGADDRVTIDMLQLLLERQKAEGVPGTTVVAVSGRDNNSRSGVANFELRPRVAGVAKTEFDKPWSQAKFVSRGGVQVLVLG